MYPPPIINPSHILDSRYQYQNQTHYSPPLKLQHVNISPSYLVQRQLLKYGHISRISEQINSCKSEEQNDRKIQHQKDLQKQKVPLYAYRTLENYKSPIITNSFSQKSNVKQKLTDVKVEESNKGCVQMNRNINNQNGKRSEKKAITINIIHQIEKDHNLGQKKRFRILSSDKKQNNNIDERYKLQFRQRKLELQYKKNVKKQQRQQRLSHDHNKNSNKFTETSKQSIKIKIPPCIKHIRHNTEISNKIQQKNIIENKLNIVKLMSHQKRVSGQSNSSLKSIQQNNHNQRKQQKRVVFEGFKIRQQCSVVYEKDSEVQMWLKALEKTKISTNQKQKSINISFLQNETEFQTINRTKAPTQINFKKDKSKQYQKGKFLGKGYFGQVYLGLHVPTGIICSLKYLDLKRLIKQNMLQSIKREIQCQILLEHPNICKIFTYYIDETTASLVLVIQFIQGKQLYKLMRDKRRFNEEETADIIFQVASALDCMHKKNIIHRDIKPQNIMVTNGIAKVCDFGWAVMTSVSRKTLCGTPLYSSPQIVLGKQYDKKIDLWSIGILTYQMIVGNLPFKVYGQHQLYKIAEDEVNFPEYVDISSKAKDFITRLLNKDPEQRMNILQILDHPFIRRRKKIIQRVSMAYPDMLQVICGGQF